QAHLGLRGYGVRGPAAAVRDVLLGLAARGEHAHVPLVRLADRQGDGGSLPGRVLMPTLGLVNIGALATGSLTAPRLDAEAILVADGRIAAIGSAAGAGARGADVVVD